MTAPSGPPVGIAVLKAIAEAHDLTWTDEMEQAFQARLDTEGFEAVVKSYLGELRRYATT